MITGGMSVLLFLLVSGTNTTAEETSERATLSNVAGVISNTFATVDSDLLFLSREQTLQGLLTPTATSARPVRDHLTKDLLSFAEAKGTFDRILLFDTKGQPLLGVGFADGKAAELASDQLLLYPTDFEQTFALSAEQVFVSPLELRTEDGRVSIPVTPVIRFSTPTFDQNGLKRGVLQMDYLAADFLQDARRTVVGSMGEFFLTNDRGFYFIHPDRNQEWGSMFETMQENSFAANFPVAWAQIAQGGFGQFRADDCLVSYLTVFPLREIEVARAEHQPAWNPPLNPLPFDWHTYPWKVITVVPLTLTVLQFWLFVALAAALFVLLVLGAWHAAKRIV